MEKHRPSVAHGSDDDKCRGSSRRLAQDHETNSLERRFGEDAKPMKSCEEGLGCQG